ncbi:hypothetical protein PR001_g3624 [Phytophthora rubi]|uniref:Uncharacterized protein n=1 Tax=Phytophthora rubi TaxID=129364 RepID=A0A6A3NWJ6_9STRA|nr:hypothetical protein PR002_g9474 [Phytophthora rubi]KAE9049002.1 hypothetical protein PR001_g3624 [Phytophthora rubi]
MSAGNERESSLPEDLQRCRRLVVAIRGQVLAPSRKQQALKQLVDVVSNRQQTPQNRWWANEGMPSPRERYLREIQGRRIKTIQKRWRRHMLQKRIMAKLRMEQKWKSRQGISRFRKSALMIQRIFRGHFVRKHKIDIASYLAELVPRVERLRSDREVYHLKCENIQQELQQIRLDIEIIRDKISQEEEEVALIASKGVVAVDTAVVHEDAAESVEYYKGEVAELEEFARNLEKELQELREQEPVVHFAAMLIQALYRGVWCRTRLLRERQCQRQIYARMLQSKEFCYDRIHASWVIRNQKLWDARKFLSAYRARVAKRENLQREIMIQLDARVLQHIRTAVQTSDKETCCTGSTSEISSTFLLLIRNDVWTWQVPDKQLYFLAQRYRLPLELLPLKRIHHWLAEESPAFVDLYAPLPTQTLLLFRNLSQYFALHSRILLQVQRIHEVYEAHMLMREYLALLYTANVVRLSPSTTFSSQQRQRAVDILREKDRAEYLRRELESGGNLDNQGTLVQRGAFTSFHCVWNHRLCERCLAMRPERLEFSRQCKCCGHHQYEANTVTRDLRLEAQEVFFKKDSQTTTLVRRVWASASERCDFMVLNAFLHVLSPVNRDKHENYSLETLWKLAMRSAYEPMVQLYNQLPTGSLNDLLNASQELETWAKVCCPPGVGPQLQLLIATLKDEWTQLDAQLACEAQHYIVCETGDRQNVGLLKTSMVKRKKTKRLNQANGRLEPLVNLTPATQH